jgi:hypothetical protein
VLELADIVRGAGARYRASRAGRLLPSQERALDDIVACRTPALGGAVYECDRCGARDFAYHSCRNRHCPKCQADRAQRWLTAVREHLLPCGHFLVTFTLPAELRHVARVHQRLVYAALLREAAVALQTIAKDPAWVGGQLGILAVLHTWTRTLEYHPHAHLIVTAGGLAPDGTTWRQPAHPSFLMPGYLLSALFRRQMQRALTRAGLVDQVPPGVWRRRWTVHLEAIGAGDHAVRYLARYVFHVALSNTRLRAFTTDRVTFTYTHARTQEIRRVTLPSETFLDRFLAHILPRRFTKVRYFGLLTPACTAKRDSARRLLLQRAVSSRPQELMATTAGTIDHLGPSVVPSRTLRCPSCREGRLYTVTHFTRSRAPP